MDTPTLFISLKRVATPLVASKDKTSILSITYISDALSLRLKLVRKIRDLMVISLVFKCKLGKVNFDKVTSGLVV